MTNHHPTPGETIFEVIDRWLARRADVLDAGSGLRYCLTDKDARRLAAHIDGWFNMQATAECDYADGHPNTPAGGHAPGDGAAGTADDGDRKREVAAAPPAGRTIEPTTGIRPACPTCEGPITRETVNMTCPSCGFDYGTVTHR